VRFGCPDSSKAFKEFGTIPTTLNVYWEVGMYPFPNQKWVPLAVILINCHNDFSKGKKSGIWENGLTKENISGHKKRPGEKPGLVKENLT